MAQGNIVALHLPWLLATLEYKQAIVRWTRPQRLNWDTQALLQGMMVQKRASDEEDIPEQQGATGIVWTNSTGWWLLTSHGWTSFQGNKEQI